MPRLKHDRDGWTYACPVCDNTTIYERTVDSGHGIEDPEKPYRCENSTCGATFLYAIERPIKTTPPGNRQSKLPVEASGTPSRELSVRGPEGLGLSPIGARGGAD